MGRIQKKASHTTPWAKDQGMPYLVGSSTLVAVQYLRIVMPASGVVNFVAQGLRNMADTNYSVIVLNETGTNAGKVAKSDRQSTQITVTGPTAGDELALLVIGRLVTMPAAS